MAREKSRYNFLPFIFFAASSLNVVSTSQSGIFLKMKTKRPFLVLDLLNFSLFELNHHAKLTN